MRESAYLTSDRTAEKVCIPVKCFENLVCKLVKEAVSGSGKTLRMERDALTALQEMTEQVMIMFLEMTSKPSVLI
jgi:hypothetical protein